MKRPVIFRPVARDDFVEACAWYESEGTGLGDRFELAVERALESIATGPNRYAIVYGDVRRALVKPFPYGIFYRLRNDEIHVLAIMHGRRDPNVWTSRADQT